MITVSEDTVEIITSQMTEMRVRNEELSKSLGAIGESADWMARILNGARPSAPGATQITMSIEDYMHMLNLTDRIRKEVSNA